MSKLFSEKISFLFWNGSPLKIARTGKSAKESNLIEITDAVTRPTLTRWKMQQSHPKLETLTLLTDGLLNTTNISGNFNYTYWLDDVPFEDFVKATELDHNDSESEIARVFDIAYPLNDFTYSDFTAASETVSKYGGSYYLEKKYKDDNGVDYKQTCVVKVVMVKQYNNMNQYAIACSLVIPSVTQKKDYMYFGLLTDKRDDTFYWVFSEYAENNIDFFYMITSRYPNDKGLYEGQALTLGQSNSKLPMYSNITLEKVEIDNPETSIEEIEPI